MERLVENIGEQFVKQGIITAEDEAVVKYGLQVMLCTVYAYASIGLLAWLMGRFLETAVFILSFILLRSFAGGYHAASFARCYLYSLLAYFVFYLVLLLTPPGWYSAISLGAVAITVIIVFLFAPCIHENRRVANDDKRYRRISRVICIVDGVCICIGGQWINEKMIYAMALGLLFEAVSILIASVKMQGRENDEED